jgi:hypothetical protein
LLNKAKHNYTTIDNEALTMIYALHKFRHFFVGKQICLLCRRHGFGIFGQPAASVWKDNHMAIVIFGV